MYALYRQIFARPEGIHSGRCFSNGDYKDLRVSLLLRKIRDFDIVILQVWMWSLFTCKPFCVSSCDDRVCAHNRKCSRSASDRADSFEKPGAWASGIIVAQYGWVGVLIMTP